MKKQIAEIEAYEVAGHMVPAHKIAFSDSNPEGDEVLVCVHSLITNSHDFDFIAQGISKDFRIIAIDMPGRGDSDWFEDDKLYNYDVYVADFLTLLEALGIEKFHFLGISMGGITGMILASKYPEKFKSLILNDIGPHIPGPALAKIRKYVGMKVPMLGEGSARKTLQKVFKYFGIVEEYHWDHMLKYNTRKGPMGFLFLNYDPKISTNFVVDMENPQDVTFWDIWEKIEVPTLLIHGEKSDILLQETVDKMNERHNMDLYVMHGVGHAPALFDKTEIKYIESWLMNIKQSCSS